MLTAFRYVSDYYPGSNLLTSLFGWEAVSQADMAALKASLEILLNTTQRLATNS